MPDEVELIDESLLQYMEPAEKEYYTQLLRAKRAKLSPLDYACYVTPMMQRYEHLEYLNTILVALAEKRLYKSGPGPAPVRVYKSRMQNRGRKDKRGRLVHPVTGEPVLFNLGVNMPPRHGKSMLISEHFIPWFMTNYPDETIIFATHSGEFAKKWGRFGRAHIKAHPELGLQLSDELQSSSNWGIQGTRGSVIFRGTGGSIVGEGGNGVTDDPVGGEEEAANPAQMEKLWSWINGVWRNRIQVEKIQVLVQTRWAFNDPTGKYKETEDGKWFWVNLPALAYEETNEDGISIDIENNNMPDPLDRTPGQALCPEMYDEEWLEDMRAATPYWFDALYQGRPSSSDTGMFRQFNHYRLVNGVYSIYSGETQEIVAEDRCYRFATLDTAATEKKTSDYTVFMVFDFTPSRKLLVRHVERVRIQSSDHKSFLYEQAAKWGVRWTGIETKTYGLTLYQKMVAEGKIEVRELKADTDKVSRALVAAELLAQQQLFSSIDAAWKDAFERECIRFLKDAHDDQVDALAYGAKAYFTLPEHWDANPRPVAALVGDSSSTKIARPRRPKNDPSHDQAGSW